MDDKSYYMSGSEIILW